MVSRTCFIALVVAITMTAANPSSGYVLPHERPGRDRAREPVVLDIADNNRPPTRGSTSVGHHSRLHLFSIPRELQAMKTRLVVAEDDIDALDTNYASMQEQMNSIQTRMDARAASPINMVSADHDHDLAARVTRLESENQELRGFLVAFERFLDRVVSDDPATFDPLAAPAERLSRLHEYLGNAEAELIGVNQPTVVESQPGSAPWAANGGAPPLAGDGTESSQPSSSNHTLGAAASTHNADTAISGFSVASSHDNVASSRAESSTTSADRSGGVHLSVNDADRLAAAMERLGAQNQELTARLQSLEQKAEGSKPIGVQSFGIASQTVNSAITEELLDKVDRLEQVVALQASAVLDDSAFVAADQTVEASMQARQPVSGGVGVFTATLEHPDAAATASLVNRDGAAGVASTSKKAPPSMSRADVEIMKEVLEETRSQGSGSRKSAFSVARTRHLLGSNDLQVVEFDHVFVNKGRDFHTANSTFICERRGYYFVTFTLRSYDGRYLGVSLMKNSDVVTAVYTDADSRNVMESQSAVLHLEPGDALYLLLGPSEQFALHSDIRKYVTFSGFMVYSGH